MTATEPTEITPLLIASVNGQVIDAAGNPWGFAVLQFSLFVPSGQKPIELSTGLVIPNPPPVVCDASGNFATALQKTDSVVPGALWQLIIFPFNNRYSGHILEPFQMLGPLNLTSMIQAQLPPHVDTPLVLPMSNSGTVGQSPLNGSVYFDVEAQELFVRNPATGTYIPIGPAAAPPPPTQQTLHGITAMVAGILTLTFSPPFSTNPAVTGTIIDGSPAGTVTVPNIWIGSIGLTSAVFRCSNASSTDFISWVATGPL